MRPTSIGEIAAIAAQANALDLALGSPDSNSQSVWAVAAVEAIRAGISHYTEATGLAVLKNAITQYLGRASADNKSVPIEATCVTAGATEALAAALIALQDLGDEVVIFEPFYEGYLRAIHTSGATVRTVRLCEPNWQIDATQLAATVGPRTRAVIVNNPHNPTGRVFSAAEIESIEIVIRDSHAAILSDEVYSEFYYGTHPPKVIGQSDELYRRTLRIGSASKMMGVAGWRVGWVAGPERLVSEVAATHFALSACAPAPLQVAVATGLQGTTHFCPALRRNYLARKQLTRRAFSEAGFEVSNPDGSFYLLVSSGQYRTSDQLYEVLLNELGLATVPMSMFYAESDVAIGSVRVAFCKPESVLVAAAARLAPA